MPVQCEIRGGVVLSLDLSKPRPLSLTGPGLADLEPEMSRAARRKLLGDLAQRAFLAARKIVPQSPSIPTLDLEKNLMEFILEFTRSTGEMTVAPLQEREPGPNSMIY